GGQRDVLAESLLNFGVILNAIQRAADFAPSRIPHAGNQTVARRHVPFVRIQEIDPLQADFGSVGAELFERDLLIAPTRSRLADLSLTMNGRVLLGRRERR